MSVFHRLSRRFWLRLIGACAVIVAAWPQWAFASCNGMNPIESAACSMDVAQYRFYDGIAGSIWLVDRLLLSGAYWLDALRDQFVNVIFSSAYSSLTTAIGPLLGPAATVALLVGALLLIALPITGATGQINFRLILIWGLCGPLLLTLSGPLMVQFETMRVDMGASLFTSVAGNAFSLGKGAANDMAAPKVLYPSSECGADGGGQPILRRYTTNKQPTIDEQVAALVWASAKDIHCPLVTVPERFFADAPDGPGYMSPFDLQNSEAPARQRYLKSIQLGITRLLLTFLPAVVAFLVALMNFVFACCTMMLWFSLPVGLLFSFFHGNATWFTDLVKRGSQILKTSWMISILLGVFSAILLNAGAAGDALRYTIMTIISGIFVAQFTGTSFSLFSSALNAVGAAAGMAGGPTLSGLGSRLGKGAFKAATTAGVGAVTGGVGAVGMGAAAAFTARTALAQTGSNRYALGAAMGRIKPLMQLGEVAANMGMVGEEGAAGLYAGAKSAQNTRLGRKQMMTDAKAKMSDGRTIRARAEDRGLDDGMARLERRSLIGAGVGAVGAVGAGVKAATQFTKNNLTEEHVAMRAQQIGRAGKRGMRVVQQGVGQFRQGAIASARAVIDTPRILGDGVAAGVKVASAGLQAGKHGARVVGRSLAASYTHHAAPRDRSLDVMWKTQATGKRPRFHSALPVPADQLPADAMTEELSHEQRKSSINDGYRVQRNGDGTATRWKAPAPSRPSPVTRQRKSKATPIHTVDVSKQRGTEPQRAAAQDTAPAASRNNQPAASYYVDARAEAEKLVARALQPKAPKLRRADPLRVAHQRQRANQIHEPPEQPWRTTRRIGDRQPGQRPRPSITRPSPRGEG